MRSSLRSGVRVRRLVRPTVELFETRRLLAATAFTIDPTLSSIRVAGFVGNTLTIMAQDPQGQSLTTSYGGTINADVSNGAITFTGAQLAANTNGSWKPDSHLNADVSEPADYGGQATPDQFNYLYMAARDIVFNLTSAALPISAAGQFDQNSVDITSSSGTVYYGGLRSGSEALLGDHGADEATSPATYVVSNGRATLTLPVLTTIDTAVDFVPVHLEFSGQVVATATVSSQPAVTAASFDFSHSPQSLAFQFDRPVTAGAGALQLQNLTTGQSVQAAGYSFDAGSNTATFQLPGVLPDGNYRATLAASAVTDSGGGHLVSDYNYNFYFLRADVNRDRTVNFSDLLVLAQNYGRNSAGYAQGDVNFDGRIDFSDLLLLAQNYGRSLPAPTAVAASLSQPDFSAAGSQELTASQLVLGSPAPLARKAPRQIVYRSSK